MLLSFAYVHSKWEKHACFEANMNYHFYGKSRHGVILLLCDYVNMRKNISWLYRIPLMIQGSEQLTSPLYSCKKFDCSSYRRRIKYTLVISLLTLLIAHINLRVVSVVERLLTAI